MPKLAEDLPSRAVSRKPVLPARPSKPNTSPEEVKPFEQEDSRSLIKDASAFLPANKPLAQAEPDTKKLQEFSLPLPLQDRSAEKPPLLPRRPPAQADTKHYASPDEGDEPPPYDEDDMRRAEEANLRALDEFDLNAQGGGWRGELVESPTVPDDDDEEDDEADVNEPETPTDNENSGGVSAKAKLKTAYQNTKHFAGGLIAHPVQSTRHYSVLRHSHGLVAYRGLATHVAVTIFADDPFSLPLSRRIFLQQRGWSGQRGMRFKAAMGRRAAWRDVTPQAHVNASAVRPTDERAWQRDMETFLRKAGAEKAFARRRPVETCVVRIPVAAADGYFRLVVCDAEGKILCPSPVFRVASLSRSAASFRGASLATLPLEVGIKALSTFAGNMAMQGAAPLQAAIHNRFGSLSPGALTRGATTTYNTVGKASGVVDSVEDQQRATHEEVRDGGQVATARDNDLVVLGDEAGPVEPYPLRFSGLVVRGAGRSNINLGLPTANLSGVRDEMKTRLEGVYFGWGSITQSQTIASDAWRPCLMFARPADGVPGVAPKKVLRVFIIEDLEGASFFDAKLSILLMGFVRGWDPAAFADPKAFARDTAVDILMARQSLDRPAWQPDETLQRLKRQTTLADRVASTRQAGQRQFERIPFDKLAIRMPQAELKEGLLGQGGLCIDRRSEEM